MEKLKLQNHKLLQHKQQKSPRLEAIKTRIKLKQLNKLSTLKINLEVIQKINLGGILNLKVVILNLKEVIQRVAENITTKNAQVLWYTFLFLSVKSSTTTTFYES